jgi:hypothetical protein
MTFANGLQPSQQDTDWILWAKIVQMLASSYAGSNPPGNFANTVYPQGDDPDHQLYAKAASLTYAWDQSS